MDLLKHKMTDRVRNELLTYFNAYDILGKLDEGLKKTWPIALAAVWCSCSNRYDSGLVMTCQKLLMYLQQTFQAGCS